MHQSYFSKNCPTASRVLLLLVTLREKCPNTEFFPVWTQGNTDQKKLRIGHFSRSVRLKDFQFSNSKEI